MRPTLFISDLHLHETRPETLAAFFRFLRSEAIHADALYILGDLFEYWVGDDQLDHDPLSKEVANALKTLANTGVSIYFMHGNRDFLVSHRFAAAAGLTLIDDPTVIHVNSRALLLLHGDTLCTDDVSYQQFRIQARDPEWQANVLAKPYAERIALANHIRMRSDVEKANKPEAIMDVTIVTVERVFAKYNFTDMIHGHTHRPMQHNHTVDGHECHRRVLADWHDSACWYAVDMHPFSEGG